MYDTEKFPMVYLDKKCNPDLKLLGNCSKKENFKGYAKIA